MMGVSLDAYIVEVGGGGGELPRRRRDYAFPGISKWEEEKMNSVFVKNEGFFVGTSR